MKSLAIVTLLFGQLSFAAGLKNGNEITLNRISGTAVATCQDRFPGHGGSGTTTQTIWCSRDIATPGVRDHFVGPNSVAADEVTLSAKQEDGTVRTKESDYDSVKGISKSSFNLLINTLFQRSLLAKGKNHVSYTLTKNGKPVVGGQFEVNVVRGIERQCETTFVSGFNDCNFRESICDIYFEEQNYCQ